MDHLERHYLIAAHDIAKHNAMQAFDEHEVAARLDLDFEEPGWEERHVAVTQGLIEEGLVGSVSKGGGMGRRALKLTRQGMKEGQRLADPATQRRERRERFLRAVYELAGGAPGQFVYWPDVAPRIGYHPENAEHEEEAHGLAINAQQSGLLKIQVDEGGLYTITAKGVRAVEGDGPEPQQNVTNTWNLSGTFYQAAVGTHNTNTFSGDLDFSTVERRIEQEGGADKEELRELVREMRELLENRQTVDKGFLARFNDKLKEHGWLSGVVAGWLLNFATRGF